MFGRTTGLRYLVYWAAREGVCDGACVLESPAVRRVDESTLLSCTRIGDLKPVARSYVENDRAHRYMYTLSHRCGAASGAASAHVGDAYGRGGDRGRVRAAALETLELSRAAAAARATVDESSSRTLSLPPYSRYQRPNLEYILDDSAGPAVNRGARRTSRRPARSIPRAWRSSSTRAAR